MGYTTTFKGSFTFNKPLDTELKDYINEFSCSRRVKRDVEKIKDIYPNWKDLCYNGELGVDGEYFVGGCDFRDDSIIDYNLPPITQPELWCQWVINDDGTELMWDKGEKFYDYVDWLQYLYDNFFKPNGYELNGEVIFQGDRCGDCGKLFIKDGKVIKEYL